MPPLYEDVGFTKPKTKDFYSFTIRTAMPSDIHSMTMEEIWKYIIL